MNQAMNSLVDDLVDDLEPVRPMRLQGGLALAALAVVLTVLLVTLVKGLWMAGLSGGASTFYFFGNGLLILVGGIAIVNVLAMANPGVGQRRLPPIWALAVIAILPTIAIMAMVADNLGANVLSDRQGVLCLLSAMGTSILVAAALMFWLRRGAPVSPNMAGTLTGIAATALGSASYGLSCHLDSATHIGIWHAAPVLVGAVIGRFILSPLLKW